jgi:uncharacterized coiled-coil protein SlyX
MASDRDDMEYMLRARIDSLESQLQAAEKWIQELEAKLTAQAERIKALEEKAK